MNKVPKHVVICSNPDCDCNFAANPPVFDKTTVWPLSMGRDFVQENVDQERGTWSFDTYVCSCCHSQFMDIVVKE